MASPTEYVDRVRRLRRPGLLLLWTGEDLDVALRPGGMVAGLRRKYHYAVERGIPSLKLVLE